MQNILCTFFILEIQDQAPCRVLLFNYTNTSYWKNNFVLNTFY